MSKLVLFLAIPAVAGLVAWNLSLSSEIDDLRHQIGSSDAAPPAATKAGDAKPAAESARSQPTARVNPQVTELVARLAEVEKRLPPVPAAAGTAPDGAAAPAVVSASDAIATFSSDAFKGAVARVLDEREEVRRKERMERQADGLARRYLRDLTVTDQQRSDVKKAILVGMEKAEKIRDDESLSDDQRRQEIQAVQQERVESLAAVLDATQMETVRQRAAQPQGAPGTPNGARSGGGGGRKKQGGN